MFWALIRLALPPAWTATTRVSHRSVRPSRGCQSVPCCLLKLLVDNLTRLRGQRAGQGGLMRGLIRARFSFESVILGWPSRGGRLLWGPPRLSSPSKSTQTIGRLPANRPDGRNRYQKGSPRWAARANSDGARAGVLSLAPVLPRPEPWSVVWSSPPRAIHRLSSF